jgi:hypothetical protein
MTRPLRSVKPAISYTVPEAADATGYGESIIRAAVDSGLLEKHYAEKAEGGATVSRPVILADDLVTWIRNSPTERVA